MFKFKSRPLSRFTCHNLQQYSYKKPRQSQLKYSLPLVKNKTTTKIPQYLLKNISGQLHQLSSFTVETGSPAHIGPHSAAIDFIIPANTNILAAADGQVIEVIDKYSIPKIFRCIGNYRFTKLFRPFLNYIAIQHKKNKTTEFTFYAHLKQNSAKVNINQKVKAGQIIAQTGWSGWLDRPHLHFIVYTQKPIQFPQETHESLQPLWQNPS